MVTAVGAESGADIEVTERAFIQMVLGVYELKQLVNKGVVYISSNAKIKEKVFVRKPVLMTEMF